MKRAAPLATSVGLVAFAAVALFAACDDPFADFVRDVPEFPSDATLFDFVTGSLQDPSAFDIVTEATVRVDQTSQWDFMYRVTDGVSELVPFGVVADSANDAGFVRAGTGFEGVTEAPTDGYTRTEAFPVAVGDVFIARSRRDPSQVLICNRYGKFEVIDIDAGAGTILLRYLINPNCGDRVLIPGEHGEL